MTDWCCIAAVNDDGVLAQNLAASPDIVARPERLVVLRGQPSASAAYNAGLDRTRARIVVFAHQDVYLPGGWADRLAAQVARLDAEAPGWAVAGVTGVRAAGGIVSATVWSSGLGQALGRALGAPVPAVSVDEVLIVLDRHAGLRFDPVLPSFHLYGTDIALAARAAGRGVYVVDLPVVHNSRPVVSLGGGYTRAYRYMMRKWYRGWAIPTTVATLGLRGWVRMQLFNLRRTMLFARGRALRRRAREHERDDPAAIARRIGLE